MYRLLALDLDDTLLMKDLTIADRTIEAVKQLVQGGTAVTLATGRMMASAGVYAEELGLTAPLVLYNGALLQCAGSAAPFRTHMLPEQTTAALIALFEEKGWYLQAFRDDCIVVNHRVPETDMDPDAKRARVVEAGDLRQAGIAETPKLMTFGSPAEVDERQAAVEQRFGAQVMAVRTKPFLLELMAPGVSKAAGLQALCDGLGIDRSEAVVCGDSDNDREMLQWAGLGCCMANGNENAKGVSDYITQAERSLGVLEVIQKFF